MIKEKKQSIDASVIMLNALRGTSYCHNILMNATLHIAEVLFMAMIEKLDCVNSISLKKQILDSLREKLEQRFIDKFKKD